MAVPAVNTDYVKHPALDYGSVVEIDEPILIRDVDNYHLDASGATIIWTGAPGVWPVKMQSARRCSVRNLLIRSEAKSNAAVLITNESGLLGSTACYLENVYAEDGSSPEEGFTYGFRIDSVAIGGTNVNNDLHCLKRCGAKKYSDAAVYIKGTQVHNVVLDQFTGRDYVGGRWPKGVHLVNSGFVTLRDCNLSAHSYDLYGEGPDTRIVVDGFNGENSRKFGRNGTNGGDCFLAVRDVRWEGTVQADDPVIFEGFGKGPFSFQNAWFDGDNGVSPRMVFTGYGDGSRTIKSSLHLLGVKFGVHTETYNPSAGPEVTVPRGWAYLNSGTEHITKRSSASWVYRSIRVERGL